MTLLFSILWLALAASLLLGGLVGAWAGWPRDRGALAPAGGLAAVAALLSAVAVSGPVAGRPGFWVEIGAFCLDGYLAGCILGCVAGGLLRRRPAEGRP